jgi:microcystin-dependent protein
VSTPGILNPLAPTNADFRRLGDDEFRALKAWLLRLFGFDGLASVTIANNPFTIDSNGDITSLRLTVGIVPTGAIISFGSITPPVGWLLCDGSAVSRTIYAALFAVVGTAFGAGDGSTTFTLPNLTDKFLKGSGTINEQGGQLGVPNHTHSINIDNTTHTHEYVHKHIVPVGNTQASLPGDNTAPYGASATLVQLRDLDHGDNNTRPLLFSSNPDVTTTSQASAGHQHGGATGVPTSFPDNRPPFVGVAYIIKT